MALLTEAKATRAGELVDWTRPVYDRNNHRIYEPEGHTPLAWSPHPMIVLVARDRYRLWWRGLAALAKGLRLAETLGGHEATGPRAPAEPWGKGEGKHWAALLNWLGRAERK